jgi:hypothetical protein
MVVIGEIHTGLVQHSTALSAAFCEELLQLREGESARRSERPTAQVVSPSDLAGVDCLLPSKKDAKVRGVGTVSTRAVVVGGRILQSSSYAEIGAGERRMFWSHYLSRPGVVDALGKVDLDDLSDGFVSGRPRPDTLNIESICARMMDRVQRSPGLDQRPAVRAPRTRLRWVLEHAPEPDFRPRARFSLRDDTLRTLEITVGACAIADALALCEDLAWHDWLLTTLSALLEQVRGDQRTPTERIIRLGPVVEHLLDLWMPGAHVDRDLMLVWDDLETVPGYSRQWDSLVAWIRDQMSVATVKLLHAHATSVRSGQFSKNT